MSKLSAFFTNRREKTLDILKNMDLDFAALQKKKKSKKGQFLMRDNNLGSSWSTKRNAFQGTLWLQGYDFLSYDYLSSLLIALDLNSVTFSSELVTIIQNCKNR